MNNFLFTLLYILNLIFNFIKTIAVKNM